MAEKSDRAGEIYRAEIGFGNFTSRVKFLLMPVISPDGKARERSVAQSEFETPLFCI